MQEQKIQFSEVAKDFYSDIPGKLKLVLVLAVCLFVGVAVSGWIQNYFNAAEVKRLEAENAAIKAEEAEHYANLARIASQLKEKESELQKLEIKREEKSKEYEKSKVETDNAVNDVDRARRTPRADNPGANELCAELAELGYKCE